MKYILLIALILTSCGGGTSGTSETLDGLKRVFSGQVLSESGEPIEDALIEIDNGQASAKSDQSGRFVFSSEVNEESSLKVKKDDISSSIKLPKLSSRTSVVNLDIRESGQMFVANNLELSIETIGGPSCEDKFSTLNIITLATDATPFLISDQLVKTDDNVSCFATISISINGEAFQGVGAEMYFKSTELNVTTGSYSTELVSSQKTNVDGKIVFEFKPSVKKRGSGYFVIETPSSVPFRSRVAVVINPLL